MKGVAGRGSAMIGGFADPGVGGGARTESDSGSFVGECTKEGYWAK